MFFTGLIILIWALLAFGITPDMYGWLMLVGASWVAGYLDCRFFKKSDTDSQRTLPPETNIESDKDLFQVD